MPTTTVTGTEICRLCTYQDCGNDCERTDAMKARNGVTCLEELPPSAGLARPRITHPAVACPGPISHTLQSAMTTNVPQGEPSTSADWRTTHWFELLGSSHETWHDLSLLLGHAFSRPIDAPTS